MPRRPLDPCRDGQGHSTRCPAKKLPSGPTRKHAKRPTKRMAMTSPRYQDPGARKRTTRFPLHIADGLSARLHSLAADFILHLYATALRQSARPRYSRRALAPAPPINCAHSQTPSACGQPTAGYRHGRQLVLLQKLDNRRGNDAVQGHHRLGAIRRCARQVRDPRVSRPAGGESSRRRSSEVGAV